MRVYTTHESNFGYDYCRTIQVDLENGDSFSIDVGFNFSYIRTNPTIYVDIVLKQTLEPIYDTYERYLSTNICLSKSLLIDDHEFVVKQDKLFKEFCKNLMGILECMDESNTEILNRNNIRKVLKTVLKYTTISVYGVV